VIIGLGLGDFWMPLFGHKNKSKIVELGRYWMPFLQRFWHDYI